MVVTKQDANEELAEYYHAVVDVIPGRGARLAEIARSAKMDRLIVEGVLKNAEEDGIVYRLGSGAGQRWFIG